MSGPAGRAATERSGRGFDAGAVVERARAVVEAGGEAGAGARVLKSDRRTWVVWLDDAGPEGGPVVVKTRLLRSRWDRIGRWLRGSPAERQRRGAEMLVGAGIGTATPYAAVDADGPGGAVSSSFLARGVADAEPLQEFFVRLDPRARRRLARDLGEFVARLHTSGIYVPDLKDENLLVRAAADGFEFVLVDLDRVARPRSGVSPRRRIANLVQLDRSLGWVAVERERLALLGAWRRATIDAGGADVPDLVARVDGARRRKDRAVGRRRRRLGIVPRERQQISCVIITGNEIERIRACLESVRWCDEIIVVDSYSTDGTRDVCLEFTPRVVQREWTGYRDQKAYALELATRPWVLNVDADECVSPELQKEIDWVLRTDGGGFDGFTVPRLVRYLGRWWRWGGWYPDRRLRLFRRERATWGGVDPHERVLLRGRVGRLHADLWHYTYEDIADHVSTIDRFTTIATGGDRRRGLRRVRWTDLWLRPFGRFLRFYLLRAGFRMGDPGLFVAISATVYVHLKYAKRDEAARLRAREAAR